MILMGGLNMSKVILLNLPIQSYLQRNFSSDFVYNPSLGLIYIGTWLEMHGYEPIVIDLSFDRMAIEQLMKIIAESTPVFIGMSVYTENIEMAIQLAKTIKGKFNNINIVFGGSHPTLVPNDAISSKYVDFVVRKEGEPILLELAEAISSNEDNLKYDDITGLLFKRDGHIIDNGLRPPIKDLDMLPIPKRELVNIDKYERIVNISTSRGCPGNCIYCAATALSGATYRVRSIENVFLEIVLIKSIMGSKLHKIYIVDDTFTAMPERVKEFASMIKEYNLNVYWHCESRVDIMSEELLDLMADSGCIAIQYGLESGSQQVLDKIRKGIDLEHAKKIINYTFKKRITICLSFMLGHFCDTKETMEETGDFVKEMFNKYKAEIVVSFNTPFPGTWQHTNMDKLGMRLITDKYKRFNLNTAIVETDNFTVYDQRTLYYETLKYSAYTSSLEKLKGAIINNE